MRLKRKVCVLKIFALTFCCICLLNILKDWITLKLGSQCSISEFDMKQLAETILDEDRLEQFDQNAFKATVLTCRSLPEVDKHYTG